jgi:hypothetical protein
MLKKYMGSDVIMAVGKNVGRHGHVLADCIFGRVAPAIDLRLHIFNENPRLSFDFAH